MTPRVLELERRAGLVRSERGLSTMEYAVLFIVIIIGAIVLWSELGESLAQRLQDGEHTVEEVLDGHHSGAASPGSSGGGTHSPGRTRTPLPR